MFHDEVIAATLGRDSSLLCPAGKWPPSHGQGTGKFHIYVAEHGCKWRGLPERFGNWHTVYTRMNRWAKAGVLDRMFAELQKHQIVRIKIEAVSLDSTSIKVHPDGTGALKKTAPNPLESREGAGTPRFIWLPRMIELP